MNIITCFQCRPNSYFVLSRYADGDTEFGEYPWQVAILKKEQYDNVSILDNISYSCLESFSVSHLGIGLN